MPKPESDRPDNQVSPDAALEKRTRRRFSPEYKLRILAEADQCGHGELGQLLRREKLYSSQLRDWRRELEQGESGKLGKTRPGPACAKTPEGKRIEQLEKELSKTQHKLKVTQDCVDLQKKGSSQDSGEDFLFEAS